MLTKLFVPNGGGEWAVEGPVMLPVPGLTARDIMSYSIVGTALLF